MIAFLKGYFSYAATIPGALFQANRWHKAGRTTFPTSPGDGRIAPSQERAGRGTHGFRVYYRRFLFDPFCFEPSSICFFFFAVARRILANSSSEYMLPRQILLPQEQGASSSPS